MMSRLYVTPNPLKEAAVTMMTATDVNDLDYAIFHEYAWPRHEGRGKNLPPYCKAGGPR